MRSGVSFSKKLLKFGRRVERAWKKQKVKRALLFQQQNPRSPTFTHTLTLLFRFDSHQIQ